MLIGLGERWMNPKTRNFALWVLIVLLLLNSGVLRVPEAALILYVPVATPTGPQSCECRYRPCAEPRGYPLRPRRRSSPPKLHPTIPGLFSPDPWRHRSVDTTTGRNTSPALPTDVVAEAGWSCRTSPDAIVFVLRGIIHALNAIEESIDPLTRSMAVRCSTGWR